jgi:hypothetical protein
MVAAYSASCIKISLFLFSLLPLAWVVYVPLPDQSLPSREERNLPVEFSIQLSSPVGELIPIISFLPDTIVEFRETASHLDKGELTTDVISFTDCSSSSEFLHHGWSGTTSSITVSEEV